MKSGQKRLHRYDNAMVSKRNKGSDIWNESSLDRVKSENKGPQMGVYLSCSRKCKGPVWSEQSLVVRGGEWDRMGCGYAGP